MDIPALSTQLAVADAMTQYGTAVLAKTLETLEVQGDAVIKMMEKSVQPHLGQSIDIRLSDRIIVHPKRTTPKKKAKK